MSFNVKAGTIPDAASEFHGHINRRVGQPALEIRYLSEDGNPAPWSSMAYQDRTLSGATNIRTYSVDGLSVAIGETTVKGSTVQADGTVVEWERPAIAYGPVPEVDSLGDGDGATSPQDDVLYLFPAKDADATKDAHALARQKAESEADTTKVLYAQALDNLVEAKNNVNRERDRIRAMKGAGITVTPEEENQIIATAQAQVDHWEEEVERLAPEEDE